MTGDRKNKNNLTPDTGHLAPTGERLAKRMAAAGLCSRREAETWILGGIVKVNGKVINTPAFNVSPDDAIVVDGKKLEAKEQTRVWLYYKPLGLLTTHNDPGGRPTVFAALPKDMPRVISVGRLDINSEGLLLLTNNGALSRKLELPSNGWIRRYRVRVHGRITAAMIAQMKKGVVHEGVHYGSIEATIEAKKGERAQGANTWLMLALKEGKNREIRNVFAHFDCSVNRLIRVSYGPFQLGAMKEGEIKEVNAKVLESFIGKDKK